MRIKGFYLFSKKNPKSDQFVSPRSFYVMRKLGLLKDYDEIWLQRENKKGIEIKRIDLKGGRKYV